MAGFDFDFRCGPQRRNASRSLMRQLQLLARSRGLRVRFRWKRAHYYATVDGPLVEMEALLLPVTGYLLGHADALLTPRRRSARRCLCAQLIEAYAAGVERISEGVREAADAVAGVPNSYHIDVGKHTHIKGALISFTRSLVLYHNRFLPPAQITEATHTAIEILLKCALPVVNRGDSFQTLVDRAVATGHLDCVFRQPLSDLKILRRDAKHRGQGVTAKQFDELLPSLLSACQVLAGALRDRRPFVR